ILDVMEVEEIAERMRARLAHRGEPTAEVVVVQGDTKETLRFYGDPYSVSRARRAVQRCGNVRADRAGLKTKVRRAKSRRLSRLNSVRIRRLSRKCTMTLAPAMRHTIRRCPAGEDCELAIVDLPAKGKD